MRALLLLLCLGGCHSPDVQWEPHLACTHAVFCNVIVWNIGSRHAASIGGTHGECHCHDPPTVPVEGGSHAG